MKKSIQIKLTIFIILGFILAVCFVLFGIIKCESFKAYADTTELKIVDENNLNALKETVGAGGRKYTRVYSETGNVETYESPLEPEYIDYISSDIYSKNTNQIQSNARDVTNPFEVTTIVDSDLPDSESIVVVFMGDGYTAGTGIGQQGSWPNPVAGSFLSQAKNAAYALISTHPFNLFSNIFKVYAVQTISPEEGISYYPYGNGISKNTYFGAYVTSPGYIAMPSNRQTHALELVQTVSSNVAMVQILSNTDVHGGVSYTGTYSNETTVRLSLVATQSTSNTYWSPAWHGTVVHEFGHSVGQLVDEHSSGTKNELRANVT